MMMMMMPLLIRNNCCILRGQLNVYLLSYGFSSNFLGIRFADIMYIGAESIYTGNLLFFPFQINVFSFCRESVTQICLPAEFIAERSSP